MLDLKIVYQNPKDLLPAERNPRVHPKKQLDQIARSIKEFGFLSPVLVDANNRLLAGHGRVEAAKLLKLESIPTLSVSHLTEAQARAFILADNKIAVNAGWDEKLLAAELQALTVEYEFNVDLTGFCTAEVDALLAQTDVAGEAEKPYPIIQGPAVSRRGDLWRIGDQLVLCGDALDPQSFAQLLGTDRAQMNFTDPPYNVPIKGHVSGLGKVQHEEFAMASGEMSESEFSAFLATVFQNMAEYSVDGSLHYVCMDWRHMAEVLAAKTGIYSELKNVCVWNKTNAGMGSLYRSQHELVFVLKKGAAAHINNVELGKNGRYRTNVWTYAGANTFGQDRDKELAMHPTVKPVALVADAIKDATGRNDIVLDAFGGSGTTLVAAGQTGRRGRAIEISPQYVDTIVKRLREQLKAEAYHVPSNQTFDQVKTWRATGID